ncbi:hypothetical protein ACF1BP_23735 [Streptomyces sp. NPDC014735]|uniref:Type II toxin-antitoxin system HicA family toxin n=2 Tax=Streptomyces TaxID=1883 RepID=A0ABP7DTB4_9ACTN|nr:MULTISPECIES: hypothetical protein [Streptomyces]MBZ3908276.1 hypothetical protein [Streptomyces griseiscabiei]MDX2915688.1 hypothetical protein [Streptomyces griseiscabiei]
MATKKDLNQLKKKAEKQGFRFIETKSSHYKVYLVVSEATAEQDEVLTFVTTLPSTPSEYRGLKNAKADLKRFGFVYETERKGKPKPQRTR